MGYPNRRSIERWRKEHGPRHCAARSPELVPGLHQSLRKPACENITGNSLYRRSGSGIGLLSIAARPDQMLRCERNSGRASVDGRAALRVDKLPSAGTGSTLK